MKKSGVKIEIIIYFIIFLLFIGTLIFYLINNGNKQLKDVNENTTNTFLDKNIAETNKATGNKSTNKKTEIESSIQRNDEGKIIGKLDGTMFWVNAQVGYNARILDRTMGQESRMIYRSEDGGKSWIEIGWAPSSYAMRSYTFITEQLGFFCYKWVEGKNTNFYRTVDGGTSFEDIFLPEIKVQFMGNTYTPFIIPESPWKEDRILYMYFAQDENGDYNGGKCKALLKSEDDGRTWKYTGKIVDFKDNNG